MKTAIPVVLALAFLVGGCQTMKEAPQMATLSVAFDWKDTTACSRIPPAFTIGGVPAGTAELSFWMTDLDSPAYTHGGGEVAYAGSGTIPAGAFDYIGPCPPTGFRHRYEFAVKAIDKAGNTILGRGSAMREFPPR